MKICTIVGARPQFIKAATISRVISNDKSVNEIIIHTGQHYDYNMSEAFFTELDIPKPQYNLDVGSGLHGKQTGLMLEKIEAILLTEKPDWVLVYGDTNSTLAGSLAASKLHIPVAHIEAGLRSFNRKMPEEINRIATDHLSQLLFCPTQIAYNQLLKEGFEENQIFNVGDVMYDATLYYNETLSSQQFKKINLRQATNNDYILCTIHRAENTDSKERLINITRALIELSNQYTIILPLHPRTKNTLNNIGIYNEVNSHLKLIEPVGYLEMLALEKRAIAIVTDSGGVQKEAFFNNKPCITLRDETEWVELVELGWNKLLSPSSAINLTEITQRHINLCTNLPNSKPYGNGDAAEKILAAIKGLS